jgi:hypothetical protein
MEGLFISLAVPTAEVTVNHAFPATEAAVYSN